VKRAALLLLIVACGCSSTPRHRYVASRAGVREVSPPEPSTDPNYDGVGQLIVQIGNALASGCHR
jgi:hypothetical protein